MARLTHLRDDRPLTAWGHRGALHTSGCLIPHPEAVLTWPTPQALLEALIRSVWGMVLEETLQGLAEEAGQSLLSAFLSLESFEALLQAPELGAVLGPDTAVVAHWRSLGVETVVVEGYQRRELK